MYSRSDWGGPVDPFILIKFLNETVQGDDDPIVSFVIFEWRDEDFIRVYPSPDAQYVRIVHLLVDPATWNQPSHTRRLEGGALLSGQRRPGILQ